MNLTAFTPVKDDIDAINKQLAGLRAGLGFVNTQLDTTRANFGALRETVSKPIALGTLSGFDDLDKKLNSSSTSALALRNGLKATLQVGRIQGLDVFYQGTPAMMIRPGLQRRCLPYRRQWHGFRWP